MLLGEEAVNCDNREYIDNEVVERAVQGMLYMCDVLQLVVDSLNDYPFAQRNLPLHAHEHIHYIVKQLV